MLFSPTQYSENADLFCRIFGRRLRDFYSPPFGFDVVVFDEWLEVPMVEGTSTRSFIEEHYGPEAVKLVEGLLRSE